MLRASGGKQDPYFSDVQGVWLLNETSGTLADSINSYDLTTTTNVDRYAAGGPFGDQSVDSSNLDVMATGTWSTNLWMYSRVSTWEFWINS